MSGKAACMYAVLQRGVSGAVLQEGVIDALASDHSPSPCEDKKVAEGDFLQAWGGISGSESSPAHHKHTFLMLSHITACWQTDRFRFGYNVRSEVNGPAPLMTQIVSLRSILETCPGLVPLHARLSHISADCLCEYPDLTQDTACYELPRFFMCLLSDQQPRKQPGTEEM